MESQDNPGLPVTFNDEKGEPVGEARSVCDGLWQRIPAPIAAQLVERGDGLPDKVMRGEYVGLFRTSGGAVELWAGPEADALAKIDEPPLQQAVGGDVFGGKLTVAVDARVLHADGTWC